MLKTGFKPSVLAVVLCVGGVCLSFADKHDYAFPSPLPPTGTDGFDTVKQIVSFIWDDNSYSGKNGSNYEGPNWNGTFNSTSWTGGMRVEVDNAWKPGASLNELNLKEGDFGMAWAAKTLAGYQSEQAAGWLATVTGWSQGMEVAHNGAIWRANGWTGGGIEPGNTPEPEDSWSPGWVKVKDISEASSTKTNKDGSNITMTFNVITGLIVPAWPVNYLDRYSKYGYYVPNDEFYATPPTERHQKISTTWGREYAIYRETMLMTINKCSGFLILRMYSKRR